MPSQSFTTLALASLLFPLIRAHGWIANVSINGNIYPGADPSWHLKGDQPPSVVWYSDNYGQQDPLYSKVVATDDMACHTNATPGGRLVPVKAGSTLTLHWETPEGGPWRDSHEGPILDYLAACEGNCNAAKASELKFFKIAQQGMYQSPHHTDDWRNSTFGLWATDIIRNKTNTWNVRIPDSLVGQYVLRSEIFALMGAGNKGHAQMFPQCVSLNILKSDVPTKDPYTSGAVAKLGRDLYTETDPGILISIHHEIDKYIIPGPPVWQGALWGGVSNPLPKGLQGLPMPQPGRNNHTASPYDSNGDGGSSNNGGNDNNQSKRSLGRAKQRRRRALVV
jgi:lytic cellulose monooxygenase (C1-hydroxylating)